MNHIGLFEGIGGRAHSGRDRMDRILSYMLGGSKNRVNIKGVKKGRELENRVIVYQMIYELEINGVVVKRMGNYPAIREANIINYAGAGDIFTYRPSSMNSVRQSIKAADVQESARMRRAGKTWSEIAKYMGCTEKTIKRHFKRVFPELLKTWKQPSRKLSASDIEYIIALRKEGNTFRQINEKSHVNASTVYRIIKKYDNQNVPKNQIEPG